MCQQQGSSRQEESKCLKSGVRSRVPGPQFQVGLGLGLWFVGLVFRVPSSSSRRSSSFLLAPSSKLFSVFFLSAFSQKKFFCFGSSKKEPVAPRHSLSLSERDFSVWVVGVCVRVCPGPQKRLVASSFVYTNNIRVLLFVCALLAGWRLLPAAAGGYNNSHTTTTTRFLFSHGPGGGF